MFALGYAPDPGSHCNTQSLGQGKTSELGGAGPSPYIYLPLDAETEVLSQEEISQGTTGWISSLSAVYFYIRV